MFSITFANYCVIEFSVSQGTAFPLLMSAALETIILTYLKWFSVKQFFIFSHLWHHVVQLSIFKTGRCLTPRQAK